MTARTVGVDVGGTKIVAGVVDASGVVSGRAQAATPASAASPRDVEDAIVSVVSSVLAETGAAVGALGVAAAGLVGTDRATVAFAPHLPWRGEPLRARLEHRLALPVTVENDANAAAWGEWRFGAGQGESHLVLVTVGTGLGGGVVLDGRLHRGRFGYAGEFGHLQVVVDGLPCPCGNRGCWEQYASGTALAREARARSVRWPPAAAGSPEAHPDARPAALRGEQVTQAAVAGDEGAVALLAEVGHWLGVGLANLAAAYDPGLLVIGGGVAHAGALLLDAARDGYRRSLTGRGFRPEARIVAAQLGNAAGLVGAADLARRLHD